MSDTKRTVRKLSTGEDNTLKTWIQLATVLYGEDSKPVTFLKDKAATATHGEDEEVIADERQVMLLLAQMNGADPANEARSSMNQFGIWCREFRIERGEILKDMADKLGFGLAQLSGMENNRFPIDHFMIDRIDKAYQLNDDQVHALESAVLNSPNRQSTNLIKNYHPTRDEQPFEYALKIWGRDKLVVLEKLGVQADQSNNFHVFYSKEEGEIHDLAEGIRRICKDNDLVVALDEFEGIVRFKIIVELHVAYWEPLVTNAPVFYTLFSEYTGSNDLDNALFYFTESNPSCDCRVSAAIQKIDPSFPEFGCSDDIFFVSAIAHELTDEEYQEMKKQNEKQFVNI